MKRTLKRELKVLEIAELEANGTSALVEIAASGCDIWALERKSFVWFEVVACSASQLERQLLCIREDGLGSCCVAVAILLCFWGFRCVWIVDQLVPFDPS